MKALLTEMAILKLLCLVFAGAIFVGFWAATVTKRTIHAAFLTAFTILVIATFHTMGLSMKPDSIPMISYIADWITAQFHLRLGWAGQLSAHLIYSSYVIISLLFLLLSWLGYRRQISTKKTSSCFVILILFTAWLAGCLTGGFVQHAQTQLRPDFYFVKESTDAIHTLQADIFKASDRSQQIYFSSSSLAATQKLSPITEKWLGKSVIIVDRHVYLNKTRPNTFKYSIMINFVKEGGFIGYNHYSSGQDFINATNQALPKLNQ